MNFKKVIVSLVVLSILAFSFYFYSKYQKSSNSANNNKSISSIQKYSKSTYGYFTQNKGQWNSEILFAGDTSFGSVAFTKDSILYQFVKPTGKRKQYQSLMVKLSFVKTVNPEIIVTKKPQIPIINGEDPLILKINYYLGFNAKSNSTDCIGYRRIIYHNIWTGIDLAFFFTEKGLKYEFIVRPEATLADLKMMVQGANLSLDKENLVITSALGKIVDSNLLTIEQGTNAKIPCTFTVEKDTFSFGGIPEKRKNTIIIDPLAYSSYLGGPLEDRGNGIVVDSNGNAYITGTTIDLISAFYPNVSQLQLPGSVQTLNGLNDVFVSKVDTTTNNLLNLTYFIGDGDDLATSIAVDDDSVYITGSTTSPGTGQPIWFDSNTPPGTGNKNIFVIKLSKSDLQNPTIQFIGGIGIDEATSIAVDDDSVYITGSTTSPGTGQPIWFDSNTPPGTGNKNIFVIKLSKSDLQNPTIQFIGGIGIDEATSIAVDDDSVYITGSTTSPGTGQPIWFDSNTPPGTGNKNIFVIKLSKSDLQNPTIQFIGGIGIDEATSIAVDDDSVYITGSTTSPGTGQPIWFDSNTPPGTGNKNIFVIKLSKSDLQNPTIQFIGGIGIDEATSIAVDDDSVYITGSTTSPGTGQPIWFDNAPGVGGLQDVFVLKLNKSNLGLLTNKFIGRNLDDIAKSIVVIEKSVYITGYTNSDNPNGTQISGFDNTYGGGSDAFVIKVSPDQSGMFRFFQPITRFFSRIGNWIRSLFSATNQGCFVLNHFGNLA